MTTIANCRVLVRALLGATLDASSWPDSVVDAGIRQALPALAEHLPMVETTLVCAAGREQNVGNVSDLYAIAALGWPWSDEEGVFRHVRWRAVNDGVVYIESGAPAAGDGLRVRYWRRLSVAGLDGATATSVPDHLLDLLTKGAAGYALLVRIRQIGENPAIAADAAKTYLHLAGALLSEFSAACARLDPVTAPPAWTTIGL